MTEVGVGSSAGEDREGITPDLQALLDAMDGVRARDQQLAGTLTRLFTVVAIEAGRSSRFANALSRAVREPDSAASEAPGKAKRPSNRREPGPFDPFAVYAQGQEPRLRASLEVLSLEELRDIVAEHGMVTDRLAMKWKDPQRVVERIVEVSWSGPGRARLFARHSSSASWPGPGAEAPRPCTSLPFGPSACRGGAEQQAALP